MAKKEICLLSVVRAEVDATFGTAIGGWVDRHYDGAWAKLWDHLEAATNSGDYLLWKLQMGICGSEFFRYWQVFDSSKPDDLDEFLREVEARACRH